MRTRAGHMRKVLTLVFLIFAMGLEAARPSNAASENTKHAPLKKVADIPMPGPTVRFDCQSVDASKGRLYIAQMNADQLVVFDTKKREVVGNLDGFSRVHGVWAVPELGRVYASMTGEHKVAAVDMKTLQTLSRVGPINYPDGIAYAPGSQRIFVSDEHGNADAVIDTKSNSLVASIPLGGGAGNTVYDSGSGHILVAVHQKNEVVAIDPATMRIIGRYPMTGVESPHGIALDGSGRLAFVVGEEDHMLAAVDLDTMKVLSTDPVGEKPADVGFCPVPHPLY